MTARQGAPDRPVETHADMPFCAEVREAAPVVLALRSVLGRVPVNANSLCSAIGRRYQSLRSSVIALCSGKTIRRPSWSRKVHSRGTNFGETTSARTRGADR
jgi:hypothetical protein